MLKPIYEMSPLEGILERAALDGMEVVYSRGYVGDTTTTQDGISSFQKLADDRSKEELIAEAVENCLRCIKNLILNCIAKSVDKKKKQANLR